MVKFLRRPGTYTAAPGQARKGKARAGNSKDGRSPQARAEVQALLEDAPRQRDFLIEHLHKIQDRYGSISAPHVAALASEMRLSLTEVYEVATFYHHFDVVKEGDAPPPPLTVRVCDSLSCELAGAHALGGLQTALGAKCAWCRRPASGVASRRRSPSSGRIRLPRRRSKQ